MCNVCGRNWEHTSPRDSPDMRPMTGISRNGDRWWSTGRPSRAALNVWPMSRRRHSDPSRRLAFALFCFQFRPRVLWSATAEGHPRRTAQPDRSHHGQVGGHGRCPEDDAAASADKLGAGITNG
jgi:hypothetical protein